MVAAVPTLEELLTSQNSPGAPGVNPELEQMLGRLKQLQSPTQGPGGGMPPAPQPGSVQGTPTAQGTPSMPQQAGSAAPMPPEQANMTYQMLVKAGVPPEIAKQAIAEPKFLQEILKQLASQQQQLGVPAQGGQAPQQPQGNPAAAMMGQGGAQRPAPLMS